MSKKHRITLAVLGVSAALLASGLPAAGASAATTQIYVANNGSGNMCSFSAPCGISEAKAKVRSAASTMSSDLVVNLRGGTYRFDSALQLGIEDSGQNGYTVRWQAYPGETPVFSGGRKIAGWSLVDPVKNLYRASVPAGFQSRQLFVDGVRAVRARSELNPAGFKKTAQGFSSSNLLYTTWRNQDSIEIVGRNAWKSLRCPVRSITAGVGSAEFTMQQPCWSNAGTAPNPDYYFPYNGSGRIGLDSVTWLENAFELLDQAGEFYIDSAAGQAYYIPRPGENLAAAEVEAPASEGLLRLAGTPGQLVPVNNEDASIKYQGAWGLSAARKFGNLGDDVRYTQQNGDSATITFTGTGIDVLSEKFSDLGDIDVFVDGVLDRTVSARAEGLRLAQQVVYSKTGLAPGQHTVKLVKKSGSYLVLDGYVPVTALIQPVHDISFSGIRFEYSAWQLPSSPEGYADNQAGVIWTGTPARISRTPGAFRVERGQRIVVQDSEFRRMGGAAVDLGYGTQDSTVLGNRITDISGGGVSIGEYDDFWLADPARMTSGNVVKNNAISYVGQEYEDAAGVLAGYVRNTVIDRNDISHTPYTGVSLGWGWGWDSPYSTVSQRRGTSYAQGNSITNNYIRDVMRVLNDGGPIYVLGGQGDGSVRSVMKGNVLSKATGAHASAQALYTDEGSSWWDVSENVVSQVAQNWSMQWINSIHDIRVFDNFTDVSRQNNSGTNVTYTNNTLVADGNWPQKAKDIVAAAGLEPGYRKLLTPELGLGNDGELSDLLNPVTISYGTGWTVSSGRSTGDLNQDLHAATANGSSVSFSFTGSSLSVLGPLAPDQGLLAVTVDGMDKGTVNTVSTERKVQQVIFATGKLAYGQHTVTLTKQSGTYATIDGYLVDASKDGSLTR